MLFGGQGAARCDSHSIARDSLNARRRRARCRCARHGVEFRRNSRRRAIYTFILLYLTAEFWPVQ